MAKRMDKAGLEIMTMLAEVCDQLDENETVTISKQNGRIQIEDDDEADLRSDHPRLFGRLLAIEEQLHFPNLPSVATIVIFSTFLLGLNVGWWEPILGESVCAHLNSWYGWIVELIVTMFVVCWCRFRYEKTIYNRLRAGLIECMDDDDVGRDDLLAMLDNDKNFLKISLYIKLDNDLS